MQSNKLVIIGAGSLGIMTLDAILCEGKFKKGNISFVDDNKTKNELVYGIPVIGGLEVIKELDRSKYSFIIAIANNKVRKKIAEKHKNLSFINVIHPDATVSKLSKIGIGNIILPNVTIDPESVIHNHVIINKNTSIGHNVEMENYTQASPGCQLGGFVGEGTFLGLGVTLLPNISIGKFTTIGAGAVVVEEIPDNCTAVGTPAKPIKFHEKTR